MKAIGKNINGKEIEFTFNNNFVNCSSNQLTELKLPNGVENVNCNTNKLTELKLPNGVEKVSCTNNQLTELVLPNGVKEVYCTNNNLKEITLPKKIRVATLPLNCNVLNIDEFKNRDDITIRFV